MIATHYSELGLVTRTTGYYFLLNPGSIQPHFPKSQGVRVLNVFFYKHRNTYSEKGKKLILQMFKLLEALEGSACV